MLGFDLDDQDECDITTEDDLIFLKDQSDEINLTVPSFPQLPFSSLIGILKGLF